MKGDLGRKTELEVKIVENIMGKANGLAWLEYRMDMWERQEVIWARYQFYLFLSPGT